ncbi:TPA: hypothetical protein OUE58_004474 [Enterobacter hormaechei]|nr:hypothetical protein [Enterobacter hormaechei]
MSKSLKELYAVPEWMRQFLPSFNNTGGNDVEELLHDDCTSMFANSVRYTLIVSARSQFALLMDMYSKGIITGRNGSAKCSDTLTDGQLLFRLQDFYGAGQDAMEINDHEYAQECTDVVSIIREVIESRKALEAAERRIAELEARTVTLPENITSANAPEVLEISAEAERLGLRGTYASYAVGWNDRGMADKEALRAASICIDGETNP